MADPEDPAEQHARNPHTMESIRRKVGRAQVPDGEEKTVAAELQLQVAKGTNREARDKAAQREHSDVQVEHCTPAAEVVEHQARVEPVAAEHPLPQDHPQETEALTPEAAEEEARIDISPAAAAAQASASLNTAKKGG